jgi:hypothetical protein
VGEVPLLDELELGHELEVEPDVELVLVLVPPEPLLPVPLGWLPDGDEELLVEPDVEPMLGWVLPGDVLFAVPPLGQLGEPVDPSVVVLAAVLEPVPSPSPGAVAKPVRVVGLEPLAAWVPAAGPTPAPPPALEAAGFRSWRLSVPFVVVPAWALGIATLAAAAAAAAAAAVAAGSMVAAAARSSCWASGLTRSLPAGAARTCAGWRDGALIVCWISTAPPAVATAAAINVAT